MVNYLWKWRFSRRCTTLSAEYLVRLRPQVNRVPLPALTLAQDTSTLTACGNDYSFDDIFLRSLQALGKNNDVLSAFQRQEIQKIY